jgi:hypothetical protein
MGFGSSGPSEWTDLLVGMDRVAQAVGGSSSSTRIGDMAFSSSSPYTRRGSMDTSPRESVRIWSVPPGETPKARRSARARMGTRMSRAAIHALSAEIGLVNRSSRNLGGQGQGTRHMISEDDE